MDGLKIPEPECVHGYTYAQVGEIVGTRFEEFWKWMRGQTMAICNAEPEREWVDDPEAVGGMRLVDIGPSKCDVAHGMPIVYPWDLMRFIEGRPVID